MPKGRIVRISDELERDIKRLQMKFANEGVSISFVEASKQYIRKKNGKFDFPDFG